MPDFLVITHILLDTRVKPTDVGVIRIDADHSLDGTRHIEDGRVPRNNLGIKLLVQEVYQLLGVRSRRGVYTNISDTFVEGDDAVVSQLMFPVLSQGVRILGAARDGIDEVVSARVGDEVDNGSAFAPKRDQRLVAACVGRAEKSKTASG